MTKLNTGNIYSFHYRRYKQDPNPLVLVLYCDNDICHSLNFHYLPKKLNNKLIHMIARLALKQLKTRSTYALYHNWMKKYIPDIIKRAYRTYKPNQMTSIKRITYGYWGITSFLKYIDKQEEHKKLSTVQERLSKKINKQKTKKITKQKKINVEKLDDYIKNYVNAIDIIIQSGRTEDLSKYTFPLRKSKL
jgi:hypothetical protein